jgi:hypothetical protein
MKKAPRKVIRQCNHIHLAEIEHIANIADDPTKLDTSTLTEGQMTAALFVSVLHRLGIPWKLVKGNVREVLFWSDDSAGDKVGEVEVRWLPSHNKAARAKFQELWKVAG